MDFDELASLIQDNCPEIVRQSWRPVKSQKPSRSKHVTKFGGANPFRGTKFSWPRCPDKGCGRQKSFICQINIADLPAEVKSHIGKDSGLFQFFWCTAVDDCDKRDTETDSSFYSNVDIRIIPRGEMIPSLQTLAAIAIFETKVRTDNLPDAMMEFVKNTSEEFDESQLEDGEYVGEEKQIDTWKESEVKEIPKSDEMLRNDKISEVVLSQPEITQNLINEVDFYDGCDAEPIASPLHGIKLCGYVAWCERITGAVMSYPYCTDCKLYMDITFLQLQHLDTVDDLLVYDWELGIASITLCPGCGTPGMYWDCP